MNFLSSSKANPATGIASSKQGGLDSLGAGPSSSDLIDTSSLSAFDLLKSEVNDHIAKTQHLTEERGVAVLESLKKFTGSAHRRDQKHVLHFEHLMKRLTACLNDLAQMVADADHQKVALLTWALHLESRLNSCIAYNQNEIQCTKTISGDFIKLNSLIVEERSSVQQALSFYEAIIAQRDAHSVGPYVPWNPNQNDHQHFNSDNQEYQVDANAILVGHKNNTAKLWKQLQRIITETNNKIEICGGNLSYCSSSLNVLKMWIAKTRTRKRSVFSTSDNNSGGSDDPDAVPPFDHSLCQGCSHTHESCSECVMKLAALQLQFDEALQRISLAKQLQELLIETEDAFEKAHHLGEH